MIPPRPEAAAPGKRAVAAAPGVRGERSKRDEPVLRLTGISKRFGKVLANDAISLTLHAGEVLALLGENGAGKSTLMSILFGHYVADEGAIEVFGRALPPGDPKAALAAGVGMVHQHFSLAENVSVLENVLVGTESMWRLASSRQTARRRLLEVGQRFGLTVDPDALVGSLSIGQRQRVEILKALYRGARILILDEPTSTLTPQEAEALFDTLTQMLASGLSIIFISHKLAEVIRVAQRVAVLRHGRMVAEHATSQTTAAMLASAMVGRPVAAGSRRPATQRGELVCSLVNVSTAPPRRRSAGVSHAALRDVTLDVHAGEVVAIAGVSGNGQVMLAQLLSGTASVSSGELRLSGRPLKASPAELVKAGVARIPEDRHGVGVVADMSLWENAVSEVLHAQPGSVSRWGFVARSAGKRLAEGISKRFDIRGGGLDLPARLLSGGNMQKLILGRALLPNARNTPPRLVVAHQPTWGLDIGAVGFVHDQLIEARDAGTALLVISDDLDEVMLLGDRIAVLHEGRLSAARPAAQWSREEIGLAMAGMAQWTEEAAA